jgi:heptosyltransferase-2
MLSLAAVRDLRRNFPEARIEVMARAWVADLYKAVAEVDGVRVSQGFREDVRSLRNEFDAAVLLPNSFGSALQAFLARIPERWGYAKDGRGFLLTRKSAVPSEVRGRSQVYYYRAMLEGIGLSVADSPETSLRCPEAWHVRGGEMLGDEGPWVGINPGAFFGSAKRWIPSRYAAVADELVTKNDLRVVLLGGAAERPLAEFIAGSMQAPARVLCGETSLAELVGVLSHLRLLVTNDSGPMHVASALGIPVVAIFGPTDWRETAPFAERRRLLREPVPCAPCLLRDCPIDHRCMKLITVESVANAAESLLEETAEPA